MLSIIGIRGHKRHDFYRDKFHFIPKGSREWKRLKLEELLGFFVAGEEILLYAHRMTEKKEVADLYDRDFYWF